MAEGKKRFYRLFKVAKELNVASGTLVEHLGGEGIDVIDSPNTKLTSDQYSILLKTFASDKDVKEKAEQLSEKRKEDGRGGGRANGEENGIVEGEKEHLSASQLRNKILPKKKRRKSSSQGGVASGNVPPVTVINPEEKITDPGNDKHVEVEDSSIEGELEVTSTEGNNTASVETKPEVTEKLTSEETKQSPKVVHKDELTTDVDQNSITKNIPAESNLTNEANEENGSIKLKVVGKIDLDAISGKKSSGKKQDSLETPVEEVIVPPDPVSTNVNVPENKTESASTTEVSPSDSEVESSEKQFNEPVGTSDSDASTENTKEKKAINYSETKIPEPIKPTSEVKTPPETLDSPLKEENDSNSSPSQKTNESPKRKSDSPKKDESPQNRYSRRDSSSNRQSGPSRSRSMDSGGHRGNRDRRNAESPQREINKRDSSDRRSRPENDRNRRKPEPIINKQGVDESISSSSEEEQNEVIMRAGDRTPNLKGLKVLGKIELPGNKRSRKRKDKGKDKESNNKTSSRQKTSDSVKSKSEEEKPTSKVASSKAASSKATTKNTTEAKGNNASGSAKAGDDDASDANKKKRRRRRKRKRKSTTETTAPTGNNEAAKSSGRSGSTSNNQGGRSTNNRRTKKEKPSQKEVEESIRSTFSQMGKSPSRRRQQLRRAKRDEVAAKREKEALAQEEAAKNLDVTEFITANEFADMLSVPVNEIIKKSFELGIMVSINQRLDAELLSIIAEEYGYKVNFIDVTEREFDFDDEEDSEDNTETRSPIITVMGHVDHGKTTLLDHLRKTNVTASEAGGITQHIGAYVVKLESERKVTFLDTPGHEAFTAMRARGAKATDVVIIVIAADDAVMPQTVEAINHAQAASVPIVFAINKIDKDGADPEKIKGQLAEMNFLVEDWGGNYQCQEISALKGVGVDDLLEKVILEADLLELKANTQKAASGTIIESRLDKGRGNVATVLVQNGTLVVGDAMVAGVHYGKVRALINQNGERVKEAEPSVPVQVLGLGGQPQAGDKFKIFEDESKAKDISQRRQELFREQQLRQTKRLTLEEIGRRRAIGNFEELNVIIKGDVDGSVEALAGSLLKLSTDEVQVNILLKGVGAITEGDVLLSSASDAVIIAFNVRPNAQAKNLAEREEIDIRTYSVIYDAINDVKDALEGLLSPELKEEIHGTAEVRDVFKISRVGTVAGCYVTSGKIYRSNPVRVIREGVVIYDSTIASLKRFKEDVKEVNYGYECGIMVENYQDIKLGDILESYQVNEIKRRL